MTPSDERKIGYLVLGAPRSGTNLLCHALRATGQAGAPDEWYGVSRLDDALRELGLAHPDSTPQEPRATDWPAFQRRLAERAGSGARFGVKVFHYQVESLFRSGQFASPLDLLPEDYRGDARVILVSREDVVAQAVSMAIAARTGIFADVRGGRAQRVPTRFAWWSDGLPPTLVDNPAELTADSFDPAEIHQIIAAVQRHHASWTGWVAGTRLPRLRITYEDLVARRDSVLQSAYDLLGIPARAADFTESGLQRQATGLNVELASRYRQWAAEGSRHTADQPEQLPCAH